MLGQPSLLVVLLGAGLIESKRCTIFLGHLYLSAYSLAKVLPSAEAVSPNYVEVWQQLPAAIGPNPFLWALIRIRRNVNAN